LGADMFDTLIMQDEFLCTGFVFGSPMLRAIGNRDLQALKTLFRLGLEALPNEHREETAVRYTFIHPLRLAAELHLHTILEYLLMELHNLMVQVWPRMKDDGPLAVRYYITFIKSDIISTEALKMDYFVERLFLPGKEWKVACRKTLEVLRRYGILGNRIQAFNRVSAPIHLAIQLGNDEAVSHFLRGYQSGDELKDIDDTCPFTPVDAVLDHHRLSAFRELVKAGHKINFGKELHLKHRLSFVQSNYLHVCASSKLVDLEFARILLANGVPPGSMDKRGFSVLNLAMMKGSFSLAKAFEQ
jgi:hypothetical protein